MKLRIILFLLISFFSIEAVAQKKVFLKKYKPVAQELSKEFGIPSSVILSIAGLESGWGRSKQAKNFNNFFGVVGRNKVQKGTRFRSFKSAEAGFRHFCKMIARKKYYKKYKGNKDSKAWVNMIASHGYSTAPTIWKKRVKQVMSRLKIK